MTAPVISLESRRRPPEPTCGCPRHRLEALLGRLQTKLDATNAELLVCREMLTEMVADVNTTVTAALEDNRRGARP